jgi:predicted membrane-bound spermidine synthase
MALFFIPGFLTGLEFPLANKIYLKKQDMIGSTTGTLYFSDLIGGWLAGIFGGIIYLPILGLFNTCVVIVIFKLSTLILLMFLKRDTLA